MAIITKQNSCDNPYQTTNKD
ncbi:hypothetical protein CCACVL1_31056 [Corchorus capsularis]|uniref:Uncharacterized protein n=1 Tax=Corchorus capsularis TaxID=210143 RepID=A0A1R3FU32_COCAP|nr:hypothetical protein CCACVL1_31056 [Corchorus capsularis]